MSERPSMGRGAPYVVCGPAPSTTSRALPAGRAGLLVGGVAAVVSLRVVIGGVVPAASYPAALVFAGALVTLVVASGWRFTFDRRWAVGAVIGIAGAAVLVAAWVTAAPHVPLSAGQHLGPLAVWTPVVVVVAAVEEIVLRGALFHALLEAGGAPLAIAVSSIVFGLMHVPLYGWAALPLDVAAGALLVGLRLLSGGLTAPVVAHVLADLAGGWLG